MPRTPQRKTKAPPAQAEPDAYPRPAPRTPAPLAPDGRTLGALSDSELRLELTRRENIRREEERARRRQALLALRAAVPYLLMSVPHTCESGERSRTQAFDEEKYHEHSYAKSVPDCPRCVLLVMHGAPNEPFQAQVMADDWLLLLPDEGDFTFSIEFH